MWQNNYNYYLYHHGILGQRWGKRNGPPYPLDSSNHSASEKKAGWRKSLDKQGGSSHTKSSNISKGSDNSGKDGFHLTDKQKKALKIGAAAVAASRAAYGADHLAQSGKLNELAAIGKTRVDGMLGGSVGKAKFSIDPETGFKLKSENTLPENWIKRVNPRLRYGKDYQMNCGNCAISFELQSRQLDVEARGNPNGMSIASMGSFFRGLKSESFIQMGDIDIEPITNTTTNFIERGIKVESAIKSKIGKQYPGDARGCLFVPGYIGSHWVSWVKNGKNIKFYNGQDPSRDLTKTCFGLYNYIRNSASAELTSIRLDDAKINTNIINSAVQNVGDVESGKAFDTFSVLGENFVSKLFN